MLRTLVFAGENTVYESCINFQDWIGFNVTKAGPLILKLCKKVTGKNVFGKKAGNKNFGRKSPNFQKSQDQMSL